MTVKGNHSINRHVGSQDTETEPVKTRELRSKTGNSSKIEWRDFVGWIAEFEDEVVRRDVFDFLARESDRRFWPGCVGNTEVLVQSMSRGSEEDEDIEEGEEVCFCFHFLNNMEGVMVALLLY